MLPDWAPAAHPPAERPGETGLTARERAIEDARKAALDLKIPETETLTDWSKGYNRALRDTARAINELHAPALPLVKELAREYDLDRFNHDELVAYGERCVREVLDRADHLIIKERLAWEHALERLWREFLGLGGDSSGGRP